MPSKESRAGASVRPDRDQVGRELELELIWIRETALSDPSEWMDICEDCCIDSVERTVRFHNVGSEFLRARFVKKIRRLLEGEYFRGWRVALYLRDTTCLILDRAGWMYQETVGDGDDGLTVLLAQLRLSFDRLDSAWSRLVVESEKRGLEWLSRTVERAGVGVAVLRYIPEHYYYARWGGREDVWQGVWYCTPWDRFFDFDAGPLRLTYQRASTLARAWARSSGRWRLVELPHSFDAWESPEDAPAKLRRKLAGSHVGFELACSQLWRPMSFLGRRWTLRDVDDLGKIELDWSPDDTGC